MLKVVLFATLLCAYLNESSGEKCAGTPVQNQKSFYRPGADPEQQINHASMPIDIDGYTLSSGRLGVERMANQSLWRHLDAIAEPWARGTVDEQFSLPKSRSSGWATRTTALHENFHGALLPAATHAIPHAPFMAGGLQQGLFGLLHQKASHESNVEVVVDTVNGVQKNVVRLTAKTEGGKVKSSAVLQTADLFASGASSRV